MILRRKIVSNPSGSVTIRRITGALAAYAVAFAASANVCFADHIKIKTPGQRMFWGYLEFMFAVYQVVVPLTFFLLVFAVVTLFRKLKNYDYHQKLLAILDLVLGLGSLFLIVGVFFYIKALMVMGDYDPKKAREAQIEKRTPEWIKQERAEKIKKNEELIRRMEGADEGKNDKTE